MPLIYSLSLPLKSPIGVIILSMKLFGMLAALLVFKTSGQLALSPGYLNPIAHFLIIIAFLSYNKLEG